MIAETFNEFKKRVKSNYPNYMVFKKQVESNYPNYMVDYSPVNNRVFVFKDEEPFCIAKIFLERHSKYMVFDVDTPDGLLEMIADYSVNF